MERMLNRLEEQFSLGAIGEKIGDFIPNLVAALVTFALFYLFWRALRKMVRSAAKRTNVDETAASFIDAVLKYLILSIAVVSSLNQMGVQTASLLASLGVLGITIGFAAKDGLSNVISGIFIFWDRPFVIGDLVEVEGKYGRVSAITMRSTRVVTPDGKMLAIPNNTIVSTTVASYTNFPHLRLDVSFTVGVREDLGQIEELLLAMCRSEPKASADPEPAILTMALNDYNVEMELRIWIQDEREHISLHSHFRRRLFETLRDAGVDMPFETIQLQPVEVRQVAPG